MLDPLLPPAAATSSDIVAHISLDGGYRADNGASMGVYGLAFIQQGTSLVAGGRESTCAHGRC